MLFNTNFKRNLSLFKRIVGPGTVTSAEFKCSELVILLLVLEPSGRALRRRQLRYKVRLPVPDITIIHFVSVPNHCQCKHPPPAGRRHKAVLCQFSVN